VLSFRRPAVLVPRAGPSLEQTLRADRLEEWETVEVVRAADLSGENVATAIQRALTRERLPAQRAPLDGLRRALDVFDTTLEQTEAA
jgi:predicted glycosyltransferase